MWFAPEADETPTTPARFTCGCGAVVILGEDPATFSDDMRKQSVLRNCTACWRVAAKGNGEL